MGDWLACEYRAGVEDGRFESCAEELYRILLSRLDGRLARRLRMRAEVYESLNKTYR